MVTVTITQLPPQRTDKDDVVEAGWFEVTCEDETSGPLHPKHRSPIKVAQQMRHRHTP